MKTRTLFATLAIPATAAGLLAQDNTLLEQKKAAEAMTMVAQGPVGMVSLSSEPGNFRFVTQEFTINGKPVSGAPYSAEEKTESVQTLADGTHISNTTTAKVYRDSMGRTRRELTLPGFGGDAPHTLVTITDPVQGVNYTFDEEGKVAHKMPAPGMSEAKVKAVMKLDAEMEARGHLQAGAVSSSRTIRIAPPPSSKREELPATMMEGVNVTGTRETNTIEAGMMGNDRPITITSERWYSPDLLVEVKSVRNDPRMGITTHTLTNINRGEPDSLLVQVPSDYKVEDAKTGVPVQRFEYHTTTEHKF
jgi:hypothetical protein